jgi:hypothetical protein
MKRLLLSAAAFALLAAFGGPAARAQTAAPAMPAPTGPLAKTFGYLVGTWNCTGGPMSNKPRAAMVAYEWELGNTMVEQQVDVPAAGKLPAYRGANYTAYNPNTKRVISSGINMYGDWNVSSTAGWMGATLVWVDVASADGKLGKDVVTRLSTNAFNDVGYGSNGKVEFKAHCVKAPAAAEK